MPRIVFVGPHAALAAALHSGAAFAGALPEGAVAEAIEELEVPLPPRVVAPAEPDQVVDTAAWGLSEPVGMCLDEVRELRAVIASRVGRLSG